MQKLKSQSEHQCLWDYSTEVIQVLTTTPKVIYLAQRLLYIKIKYGPFSSFVIVILYLKSNNSSGLFNNLLLNNTAEHKLIYINDFTPVSLLLWSLPELGLNIVFAKYCSIL